MPASAGVRSALRWLQRRHAATALSHVSMPPRLRGMMWSTVSAWPPQYAQALSRALMAVFVHSSERRYIQRVTT